MEFEEQMTHLRLEPNSDKDLNQVMKIWFTDLDSGFYLKVKEGVLQYIPSHHEETDLSISLLYQTWKELTDGELNVYDAIITGKVNHIGDRWEIVRFFENFK